MTSACDVCVSACSILIQCIDLFSCLAIRDRDRLCQVTEPAAYVQSIYNVYKSACVCNGFITETIDAVGPSVTDEMIVDIQ